MATDPDPLAGRRSYDDGPLDAAIREYVKDEVGKTRHLLAKHVTEATASLELGQREIAARQTEEHAQVTTSLAGVQTDVSLIRRDLNELLPLVKRVADLEKADAAEDAVAKALDKLRNNMLAFVGVLIAAASVAVVILK